MERADFDVGMMLTCRSLSPLIRSRLRGRRRPAGEQVANCMILPDAHPPCTKSVMSAVAPAGSLVGALGGRVGVHRLHHWLGRAGCHVGDGWAIVRWCHRCKPSSLQTALDRCMLHKHMPNTACTVVLDHEHDWPLIDSEVIGGEPLLCGVEGIFETVWTPELRPIGGVHVAQGCQRFARGERERASDCGRRDGPSSLSGGGAPRAL